MRQFEKKIHFVYSEALGLLRHAVLYRKQNMLLWCFCGGGLILLPRDCQALLLVVPEMEECPSLLFDRPSFEAGSFASL